MFPPLSSRAYYWRFLLKASKRCELGPLSKIASGLLALLLISGEIEGLNVLLFVVVERVVLEGRTGIFISIEADGDALWMNLNLNWSVELLLLLLLLLSLLLLLLITEDVVLTKPDDVLLMLLLLIGETLVIFFTPWLNTASDAASSLSSVKYLIEFDLGMRKCPFDSLISLIIILLLSLLLRLLIESFSSVIVSSHCWSLSFNLLISLWSSFSFSRNLLFSSVNWVASFAALWAIFNCLLRACVYDCSWACWKRIHSEILERRASGDSKYHLTLEGSLLIEAGMGIVAHGLLHTGQHVLSPGWNVLQVSQIIWPQEENTGPVHRRKGFQHTLQRRLVAIAGAGLSSL